jgi:hypothetical protein
MDIARLNSFFWMSIPFNHGLRIQKMNPVSIFEIFKKNPPGNQGVSVTTKKQTVSIG